MEEIQLKENMRSAGGAHYGLTASGPTAIGCNFLQFYFMLDLWDPISVHPPLSVTKASLIDISFETPHPHRVLNYFET